MKKIKVLFIIISIVYLVGVFEKFRSNSTQTTYQVNFIDELTEENYENELVVYLIDEAGYLVPVVKNETYLNQGEQINKTFNLLTKNTNSLPCGVYSPLVLSSNLLDYELSNNEIILNIDKLFFKDFIEPNLVIESLIYTFTEIEGIDKVKVKVNNEEVPYEYNLLNIGGTRNTSINTLTVSTNIYKSKKVVVNYYSSSLEQDSLIPITYIIDEDTDVDHFVFEKLLNPELGLVSYVDEVSLQDISLENDSLYITLDYGFHNELSINQITKTYSDIYNVQTVSLFVNDEIIYTSTFN